MRKLIVVAAMMVMACATVQAGQSRGLSLAGADKAVQDTKVAEQVSAVETQRRPLPPKAADATEKPKYTERPPGIDMSRQDRMKAAAMSQRRAPPHMAGMEMRRPRPRHWSAARIVATLHRYGIYW
jgi:hypothetical protein